MKYTKSASSEEKRKFGKFETPKYIARFIVKWAIRKGDDLILDPCVGSGILLSEAIQQLEQFCAPSKALKNVYGADIDWVAVENVIRKLGLDSRSSNIICVDFLTTNPGRKIDTYNCKGMLPLVDVVVCNPPYTRHQHLNQDYKEKMAKVIEERSGIRLSRQSSIYVYFLIHAAQFLKEKGRMAFVIPSNFLNVNYGFALKKFLVDNLKIVAIILFPERELLFPKALTTTCIVLLEKGKDRKNVVRFFKLNSLLNSQNLLRAIKDPHLLTQETWGTVNESPQTSLNPMKKWNRYFNTDIIGTRGLVPLRVIAKVKRGIATGANDFFTLSDEEVQKLEIEQRFLTPVLARAMDAPFFDFTRKDFQELQTNDKRVWLVSSNRAKDELHGTHFLKYIEQGEMKGLHLRYLTSSRRIWYSSENRVPSTIIFTYMSRKRPRFIFNEAEVLVLNTFHCIYPETKTIRNKVELKALLAYLNSNKAYSLLKETGRIYGGGLLKVEPRELGRFPVIDFLRLSKSDTETLANLFEQLCMSARNGRDEQGIRKEIDLIVDLLNETLETKEVIA